MLPDLALQIGQEPQLRPRSNTGCSVHFGCVNEVRAPCSAFRPEILKSFVEPRCGRLPGLEATSPHMEPKASCPAAAPLLERQFHVLVGVTGSVAALKVPLLVSRLLDVPGVSILTTQAWQPLTLGRCCSWGQLIFVQCLGFSLTVVFGEVFCVHWYEGDTGHRPVSQCNQELD